MAEQATGEFSPAPNQDRDEEQSEKTLTEDRINEIVNRAISARNKSQEKKLDAIAQRLEVLASPQKEEAKDEQKRSDDPELRRLKSDLEKLNARNQRNREINLSNSVRDALIASNIVPEQADKLVPYYRQFAAYESDDSDALIFRHGDDEADLRVGIESLVKSDPALKSFTAPKGVRGSGDNSYRIQKTETQPSSWQKFTSR